MICEGYDRYGPAYTGTEGVLPSGQHLGWILGGSGSSPHRGLDSVDSTGETASIAARVPSCIDGRDIERSRARPR